MLYADCEGFGGGTGDSLGSRFDAQDFDSMGASKQFNKHIQAFLEGIDRYTPKQIGWADGGKQNEAGGLYSWLLYTFSDVLVFVHENSR